jgi:multidrug efflux pump subunit AcrB
MPAGTVRSASGLQIKLNSSPRVLDDMNNLPVKVVNGATVYLRDVAQVHDGYNVQTSIVRTNGSRGALLTVMRNGKASTLDVVNRVKEYLPKILAGLPDTLKVRSLMDQSLFVRAAIEGVVKEAITAAVLTGLMILLFLGSWPTDHRLHLDSLSILVSMTV